MKRLSAEDAESFVAMCLVLARPPRPAEALESLVAALEERPGLPLPLLALALPGLWRGETPAGPAGEVAPGLADAVRAFEDHVVARLMADPRWQRLNDAAAGLPPAARAQAAGLLCEQLSRRLELPDAVGVSRAAVKRLLERSDGEVRALGSAALLERADLTALLTSVLREASQRIRRAGALLSDGEVFLTEHVQALQTLAARVALAQVALAAQAVEALLPARLKSAARDEGDAATSLEDDSAFPVGGFSSVATQGTPENLVTSELVYMDDERRPDLFDVRFVEGELLYYARDESVAVRRRRTLVVGIDAELDASRGSLPGSRYHPSVWLLGGLVALVRKLLASLEAEAVTVELVVVGDPEPIAAERAALELVLFEYRERGQLLVREVAHWELLTQGREGKLRMQTALVSARAWAPSPAPDAELRLEGQQVVGRFGRTTAGGAAQTIDVSMAAAVRCLLEGMLGARSSTSETSGPRALPVRPST